MRKLRVTTLPFPSLRCRSLKLHCYSNVSEAKRLVVVGGGASGLYGAVNAAMQARNCQIELNVQVLEREKRVLKSILISGGGRCNVTTATGPRELSGYYPRGNRELRGGFFHAHGPADVREFFETRGVKLKVEEDGRIFPVSDTATSVAECLKVVAAEEGVEMRVDAGVTGVERREDGSFEVRLAEDKVIGCDYVLLATGGAKIGHRIAESLGHTIIPIVPSLFTFKIADGRLHELSGLSVKKCAAILKVGKVGEKLYEFRQGNYPLLITHWGLSGPLILRLSAWAARNLRRTKYQAEISLDIIPEMNEEQLFDCLKKYKTSQPRKLMSTFCPPDLDLPKRLWVYILEQAIPHLQMRWNDSSFKILRRLAKYMKAITFDVEGKGPMGEEFVMAGGVSVSEVNMKSMESKIVQGFYITGEALNVDGLTGGYNFQNAWTGGYLAASSIIADLCDS